MSFEITEASYCIEYFYAKPGYRDHLIEALLKLIEPVKAEEGCLQYELLLDNKDENLVIMLVKFASQRAMEKHENATYIKKFAEEELYKYTEKFYWHDAKGIEATP